MSNQDFPKIIKEISLAHLKRIDVALEGNWNSTVSTVWSEKKASSVFLILYNLILNISPVWNFILKIVGLEYIVTKE